ncbi:MAG: SGNH/GDSL hydrolase family protein [Clostridia bacterium]|nr:SGNH/GDSL hydrolase family protein [Clostridia bacterium]
MNKRANRVYWLLIIMILILGFSFIISGIRKEKHKNDNDNIDVENMETTTNNESVTETTTAETTEEESTTEGTTISPEEAQKKLEDFYGGQVFIGDSIMSGFANYTFKEEAPSWLNSVIFLTKVSWGISSALSDESGPMYQGKAQKVTTSLGEIKPERIFINLGINEMNGLGSPGYSIDKLISKYGELIDSIKNAVPESTVYIINITPCTEEKETSTFSNETIKEFDKELESKCAEWGVEYLDLASEFGDVLKPEYSSDQFVHHNDKAYSEIWVPFLEKLALAS